jgi:hypothetical protein
MASNNYYGDVASPRKKVFHGTDLPASEGLFLFLATGEGMH